MRRRRYKNGGEADGVVVCMDGLANFDVDVVVAAIAVLDLEPSS